MAEVRGEGGRGLPLGLKKQEEIKETKIKEGDKTLLRLQQAFGRRQSHYLDDYWASASDRPRTFGGRAGAVQ